MNEIVDRLWLKTREHIGDLLDQAEQSIGTMRGLVQRAETAAETTGEDVIAAASLVEDLISGIGFIVTETAPGSGLYTIGGTQ